MCIRDRVYWFAARSNTTKACTRRTTPRWESPLPCTRVLVPRWAALQDPLQRSDEGTFQASRGFQRGELEAIAQIDRPGLLEVAYRRGHVPEKGSGKARNMVKWIPGSISDLQTYHWVMFHNFSGFVTGFHRYFAKTHSKKHTQNPPKTRIF